MPRTVLLYLTTCLLILTRAKANEEDDVAIGEKEEYNAHKLLALGATTFKELIEHSEVFVDKTLFIKKILKQPEQLILITYPRKWGKSVNLHMLKDFVEMEFDSAGNKVPPLKTANLKLFKRGELVKNNETIKLKTPLLIHSSRGMFLRYQGKYPALYLCCDKMRFDTFQEIYDELFDRVSRLFGNYSIFAQKLKNIGATDESQHYSDIQQRKGSRENLTQSLAFLSKVLHDCNNNTKVFLILDDYDDALNYAFMNENFTIEDRQKLVQLFGDFISNSFYHNPYLHKGILCGTLPIAKGLLNITNVKEYNLTTNPLYSFFGINSKELDLMFNFIEVPSNKRLAAYSWYAGYKGGKNGSTGCVYNPWSIASFVKNKNFGNYWARNSDIEHVWNLTVRHLPFRDICRNLSFHMNASLDREYWQFNASNLLDLLRDTRPYLLRKNPNLISYYISYLWHTGHLIAYDGQDLQSASSVLLHMPNMEVKDELSTKVLEYIGSEINRTLTFTGDEYRTTPVNEW